MGNERGPQKRREAIVEEEHGAERVRIRVGPSPIPEAHPGSWSVRADRVGQWADIWLASLGKLVAWNPLRVGSGHTHNQECVLGVRFIFLLWPLSVATWLP